MFANFKRNVSVSNFDMSLCFIGIHMALYYADMSNPVHVAYIVPVDNIVAAVPLDFSMSCPCCIV